MSKNYSPESKIADMKEYKRNAINVLMQNGQYATAKAIEKAFDIMIDFYMVENKLSKKKKGGD